MESRYRQDMDFLEANHQHLWFMVLFLSVQLFPHTLHVQYVKQALQQRHPFVTPEYDLAGDIVRYCPRLVRIQADGNLDLGHQTLVEFLRKAADQEWLHTEIARICLACLQEIDWEGQLSTTHESESSLSSDSDTDSDTDQCSESSSERDGESNSDFHSASANSDNDSEESSDRSGDCSDDSDDGSDDLSIRSTSSSRNDLDAFSAYALVFWWRHLNLAKSIGRELAGNVQQFLKSSAYIRSRRTARMTAEKYGLSLAPYRFLPPNRLAGECHLLHAIFCI
jgi:hypothetical protein